MVDDLTPQQIKAFRIADNSTAQVAEWDMDKLNMELLDLEYNMALFGLEVFNPDDYGEEFTLPDGDKAPFQQMTFTLADEQAEFIQEMLKQARGSDKYDNYGNENSNGNAIYRIVREWDEQRT